MQNTGETSCPNGKLLQINGKMMQVIMIIIIIV